MRIPGRQLLAALGLALVCAAPSASAQGPREFDQKTSAVSLPAPRPGRAAGATPVASASAPPELTKADVDTWLDGFVPYALDEGDIAAAEIVVVKDGRILTSRGYGFADIQARKLVDPATTLFRPGSISKTFTWTAVMQLVQAGKLDLDKDINDYLDFRIPAAFGKPITLRNLMTHTGGFEETAKYLVTFDPKPKFTLEQVLKRWVPKRIYAPGSMPAYSNYGASLAAYIVQRVSGEKFEVYIQRHIFDPLGMKHSTFSQPLPAAFATDMARGYPRASSPPSGFEMVNLAPAGALSASGDDMGRFMIAHLAGGGQLLDSKTMALMHAPANTPIPGAPSMALGFYHEDRDGLNIIGHAGDLQSFHSDMHLLLDKGVGLYISFSSAGKNGSAHVVRPQLFDRFLQRYYPTAAPAYATLSSAGADDRVLAGTYSSSRASRTNFLKFAGLIGAASVVANPDQTVTVTPLLNAAGVPKRWREIAPRTWLEVGGTDRLVARVVDGHVTAFAPAEFAPIIEFVPAPNVAWMKPLFFLSLAVVGLTAVFWPIIAFTRWRYRYDAGLEGRSRWLRNATRVSSLALLLVAIGWISIIQNIGASIHGLEGIYDGRMRLLQAILVIGVIGSVFAVWNGFDAWRRPGKRRFSAAWAGLIAAASIYLSWFYLTEQLLTLSLNY